MKNVNDALNMRNTLLQRIELATITSDPAERKKLLTIVVAGGGPTGVEVSGMLSDLRKHSFSKDYPELVGTGAGIYLVDGGAHLLAPMSAASQNDTFEALTKMGVHILLNTQVKDFLCKIEKSEWAVEENRMVYTVISNRFLRGMIKGLVGTMLRVGTDKISVKEFSKIVENKNAARATL